MFENLLTDQLPLAVAVRGQPNPLGRVQGGADGFELGRLVAALRRACAIEAVGPQKDRRPALPCRHDLLWLKQIEQMALGRQNVAVAGADGGADVFRLAGFLGDDDLVGHDGSMMGTNSVALQQEHIENYVFGQEKTWTKVPEPLTCAETPCGGSGGLAFGLRQDTLRIAWRRGQAISNLDSRRPNVPFMFSFRHGATRWLRRSKTGPRSKSATPRSTKSSRRPAAIRVRQSGVWCTTSRSWPSTRRRAFPSVSCGGVCCPSGFAVGYDVVEIDLRPSYSTQLLDWPWVLIRFRCDHCPRRGDAKLAACAARYGEFITIGELLQIFRRSCPNSSEMRQRRPQKYGAQMYGICRRSWRAASAGLAARNGGLDGDPGRQEAGVMGLIFLRRASAHDPIICNLCSRPPIAAPIRSSCPMPFQTTRQAAAPHQSDAD